MTVVSKPVRVRKTVEARVQVVLQRYRGRYIPVSGLLHELGGDDDVHITQNTARKWLIRLGCVPRGSGFVPGAG